MSGLRPHLERSWLIQVYIHTSTVVQILDILLLRRSRALSQPNVNIQVFFKIQLLRNPNIILVKSINRFKLSISTHYEEFHCKKTHLVLNLQNSDACWRWRNKSHNAEVICSFECVDFFIVKVREKTVSEWAQSLKCHSHLFHTVGSDASASWNRQWGKFSAHIPYSCNKPRLAEISLSKCRT